MNEENIFRRRTSRRTFFGNVAGMSTLLGSGLVFPKSGRADGGDDDNTGSPNPIPGGIGVFAPFGVFVHTIPQPNPFSLPNNEPSKITDFNGFVGLVRLLGGGTGTNTITGVPVRLAYRADMGFNQGEFIGTDGRRHQGTFAFV